MVLRAGASDVGTNSRPSRLAPSRQYLSTVSEFRARLLCCTSSVDGLPQLEANSGTRVLPLLHSRYRQVLTASKRGASGTVGSKRSASA